jgi:diacylglycerol kinase family enzyme
MLILKIKPIKLKNKFKIKIRMNTKLPVQVDGEPWLQAPCSVTIIKSALKVVF